MAMGFNGVRPRGMMPPTMQADPLGFMQQQGLAPGGMTPAALATRPGVAAATRPGMFGRGFQQGGAGRNLVGLISDGLLQASGRQAMYSPIMQQRQQEASEEERFNRRYQMQREDTLADREAERAAELNKPQYFSGSEDRVMFDPSTGQTRTLYDAPTPAEQYAAAMGVQPGTPEYQRAMSDYTLRGWGETALENRSQIEGQRISGRMAVRSTPTYRDAHPRASAASTGVPRSTGAVTAPILAKIAAGKPLTAGEQAALDYSRRPRAAAAGGAARGAAGGPTATDAKGNKVQWNGSAWVPAR